MTDTKTIQHIRPFEVHSIEIDGNFFWALFETASEQILEIFPFEDDARKAMKLHRKGIGFAGFTPSFMLISVADKTNYTPNEKFIREVGNTT